jgi:crotonobetainyl-CoA:carnitine CoA-transferase CaiB-like acyl-CoA transferase
MMSWNAGGQMASSSSVSPSLLHGVRVLSFGAFVAGNICALMLGELGADVVKVEARDRPEALRSYDSPDQAEVFEPSGIRTTALFAGLTRSMRSVCIDMSGESGRNVFRGLAEQADVVVENLGPGTMEKWGCSFAELKARNPQLVMLSISGYGRSGPLANFRAYASNINNYLGLTAAWAPDGIHFDFVAGIHGAAAVVAALARVDQGAPGVLVDLAQTEAGAGIMAPLYLDVLANGNPWNAAPNEVPGSLFSAAIKCRGTDEWVAIELEDARDWDVMCEFLGRVDLKIHDGAVTAERGQSLRQAIDGWAGTLTPFQAAHKLQAVGVAAGPVQNSEDLWRDIQFRSRASFVELYHPDVGTVEYPGSPARLSGTPGRVTCRGPRLGEHTGSVLREWLGKEVGEVASLMKSGAVWQPDES